MGCKKLSHQLLDLGFFPALGTTERTGHHPEGLLVGCGMSFTYDSNNGVTAIYDEEGRPWIIRNNQDQNAAIGIATAIRGYDLRWGAHVPHSNDGGHFVREVLPALMAK